MRKRGLSVSGLVWGALLAALSVVLTRFASVLVPVAGVGGLRLGAGPIPLYLAGFILGPVGGGLVGAVADLAGVLINPMGAYFPGYTLSSILTGLIPGLIAHRTGRRGELVWPGGWRVFVAILVTNVIVSLGLNPVWLSMTTGKAWKLFTSVRFLAQAVQIPLFSIISGLLLRLYINMRARNWR